MGLAEGILDAFHDGTGSLLCSPSYAYIIKPSLPVLNSQKHGDNAGARRFFNLRCSVERPINKSITVPTSSQSTRQTSLTADIIIGCRRSGVHEEAGRCIVICAAVTLLVGAVPET